MSGQVSAYVFLGEGDDPTVTYHGFLGYSGTPLGHVAADGSRLQIGGHPKTVRAFLAKLLEAADLMVAQAEEAKQRASVADLSAQAV